MKPTVNVSGGKSSIDMRAALAKLVRASVYVGVPSDQNERQQPGANNATLLYLFSKGSPLQGIPARPAIEPALAAKDNAANITKELGSAARGVLDGKPVETRTHLQRAGMLGRNAAIRWFVDPRNNWAPNRPSTVAKKGSDQPGINTGQMRRAITYVVEE